MSYSVNVNAKNDCEDTINKLWSEQFKHREWLVYTTSIIEAEIAYVQSGKCKEQNHLIPYLNSVAEWESLFSNMKRGQGEIGIYPSGEEFTEGEIQYLQKQIKFILDNRFLFESISGLLEAGRELDMDISYDMLNKRGQPEIERVASFADLPIHVNSKVWNSCFDYNRPDLWKAFLDFKGSPTEATWDELRTKVVPWSDQMFTTVWQLCEAIAEDIDGKSYGLSGRYKNGNIPTEFAVRKALEQSTAKRPPQHMRGTV